MMGKIVFFVVGMKLLSTQLTLYQKHTVFGGRWLESAANSICIQQVIQNTSTQTWAFSQESWNIQKTSMARSTILGKDLPCLVALQKKKPLDFWVGFPIHLVLNIINLSSSFGPNWGLGICHAWIVLKNLLRLCVWSSWIFRPPPWGAIAMERWGRCR